MFIATSLLLILSVARAAGAAAPGGEIPNWSAPESWTPARSLSIQEVQAATDPFPFVAVTPCRGADTRGNGFTGQYGPPSLVGGSTRPFKITGTCGVPASAAAVSFNFTVTNNPTFGDIRVFPAGSSVLVSTLNWGPNTGNVANAAVVPLSAAGSIAVQVDGPGPLDLIYDINGYYAPAPAEDGLPDTSRRAALDQFWTPQDGFRLGLTSVGANPRFVRSDGADLWVTHGPTVSRVRASDGKLLGTWTGAIGAADVLVAMGRVFVTDESSNKLYRIDPGQAPGTLSAVTSNLQGPHGIAFDGGRIWTTTSASVSTVTPAASTPWVVSRMTTGFLFPRGILYDGTNIWVTDAGADTLLKLDFRGTILQTVAVGSAPQYPVFDGTNIWVPNFNANSVTVVRASTGAIVATLTGNGLNKPMAAAFDGRRILITNSGNAGVSLWRAADLSPLGSFPTGAGTGPFGVCSDGIHFWIALNGSDQLARF